ncbi:MAG: NUDIX domain-containing protein [Candidatus Yanofskybacteria bacterium]|nr:NUDIX domain-containing protein [Candidatus Yanofskybacteria bacterium]
MEKRPKNLRFAVLAADTAIFKFTNGRLLVRLIKVNRPPHFTNHWGLPGGLILPKETADEAARRHSREKGAIKQMYLEQLYTFSGINRDPRGRVVAVAYLAIDKKNDINYNLGTTPENSPCWFSIKKLPRLAYDHKKIIQVALERLRAKLSYTNIAFALLPNEFTFGELRNLYEIILGRRFDRRNFRKKFLSLDLIRPTEKERLGAANRPAALYRFRKQSLTVANII